MYIYGVSLATQMVKNPPTMRETWVQSLGWEDPLRRAWWLQYSCLESSHSPWTEEPGGLQSMGLQRVGPDWVTKHSTTHAFIFVYFSLFSIIDYWKYWICFPSLYNNPCFLCIVISICELHSSNFSLPHSLSLLVTRNLFSMSVSLTIF